MSQFLYRAPLRQFVQESRTEALQAQLSLALVAETGAGPSQPEQRSWRASLAALGMVLDRPDLHGAEVFVELFMPLNGRRCDALLLGRLVDGTETAVVVELKQWSEVQPSTLTEHVAQGTRHLQHPSAQARDYADTLRHFHSAFTAAPGPVRVHAAAFLHEMKPGKSANLLRDPSTFGALPFDYPLYLGNEGPAFGAWLVQRLMPGPGTALAERIASGHALPSPKLLDLVVATVQGQHQWRLLDTQKTVYMAIRHAVQMAKAEGTKSVIVVRGGPGTGKSVLAIQLLADAARQHWVVAHATGSKAFQTVLQGQTIAFSQDMLKKIHGTHLKKNLPVGDLFTTFANVAKRGSLLANEFDLVVCDEAHRLWRHRRMKYPSGTVKWLTETPMVEELVRASRVTAFFLDDNQSVRAGEIGRSEEIVRHVRAMGIDVVEFDLDAQFRCAGSESYIHWVEALFAGDEPGPLDWRDDNVYGFDVADDAASMVASLRTRMAEARASGTRITARVVAGYCWRWSKPDAIGKLVADIRDPRFGAWQGSWIEKTGQHLKPLDHQYYKWATDDAYFDQVGSIYSVQGFEFDHVGVVWGEDLVRRGDKWVAQLDRNRDNAFKKDLRLGGEDPVAKLRHVYRVLLTRGMRGTTVSILDDETRAFVRDRLLHRVDYTARASRPWPG